MEKEYILFIDSGVGGLSTLSETIKLVHARFIYFADNLHSPYGRHGDDEIFKFLCDIITKLKARFNIKLVVLACNTATTSSIARLRKKFANLPFVGTEPAIKLAADKGCKNALCIATSATARQMRLHALEEIAHGTVKTLSVPSFATSIENYLTKNNPISTLELLRDYYGVCSKAASVDGVILGCTHYALIKSSFEKTLPVPVYDGNFGVAKQIRKIYKIDIDSSEVIFLFSCKKRGITQKYRKILSQILAKQKIVC